MSRMPNPTHPVFFVVPKDNPVYIDSVRDPVSNSLCLCKQGPPAVKSAPADPVYISPTQYQVPPNFNLSQLSLLPAIGFVPLALEQPQ